MSNSKSFPLPSGDVAVGWVPIDVTTGQPIADLNQADRVKILGRCSDVDDVLRDTWDGPTPLYVFPAAGIRMQIVSTSANDAAAGTGIRTVRLYYLDASFVEHEEIITLNGLTPVLTNAANIYRVNKLHAKTVGSGAIAAGAISLQAVGGAVTYSLIPASRNFARQAIYTVPAGKFMRIEHWQISSGSTGAHFTQHSIVASSDDGIVNPGVFLPKDEQGTQNGGAVIDYEFTIEDFPAGTDIKVAVVSDSNAANVIAMTAIFGRLYNALG